MFDGMEIPAAAKRQGGNVNGSTTIVADLSSGDVGREMREE